MPLFEFRNDALNATMVTFDREPTLGEEVVIREVWYRVGASQAPFPGSPAVKSFLVERIRDATAEELAAVNERGPNVLPRP
jgi:hypothetical protein